MSKVFLVGFIRGFLIALALHSAINLGTIGLVLGATLFALMTPPVRG